MRIHVVLVEPEIPQNTGNIARTCAATGAVLHLVHPLGFSLSSRDVKRAGLDYWDDVALEIHQNLQDFLDVYGTRQLRLFSTKAPRAYSEMTFSSDEDIFLLFGKETKGLPESLLEEHIHQCVRIPMREHIRSLNVSNAAAIAVYDLLSRQGFPGLKQEGYFAKEA